MSLTAVPPQRSSLNTRHQADTATTSSAVGTTCASGLTSNRDTAALSIVVPVYRSQATLDALVERVSRVVGGLASEYEIILVNDGSPDASWSTIERLALTDEHVRGINLMRNYGQHNALLCGIRAARYAVVVTIDDDLQHPPEEIPRLLAGLGDGYDVVYGTPEKQQHGILRDLASEITKFALQGAMGVATARNVSAFRALRSELRSAFPTSSGPAVSIDVLLTWATTHFTSVPVRHEPRAIGTSNYTFSKLIKHAINMLTGFTTLPLQIASMVGFTFTLLGLLVLAYVVGRYMIQGTSVPGFPFLASIIAIFSGAQLFALGIMGEYLARMHFRMMDRPAYVVRGSTHGVGH